MELMSGLPDGLDSVIIDHIDRPVLLVDGHTTEVQGINKAGIGFFRMKDELKGVFWPGILNLLNVPPETDLKNLWLIKEGHDLQNKEARSEKLMYIDREDSTERYLEFQLIKPLSEQNQWAIIIHDRTTYEHTLQSRTDFVTMATHQLRTPLAAIKWNVELFIKRYKSDLSEQQLHILENTAGGVARMNELIAALLQLSRIETGALKLKPMPVEIHELLENVVKAKQKEADDRNIRLVTSFHKNLPKLVIDGTLVGYVFDNLIANAIKYSHNDSEVTIFMSKMQDMLLLQVTDSGIGIPRERQKFIFDKFYRDKNAIQHAPDGTGLGLHLCRIIAHRSGGEIWFKSEEGKGSAFWFTIPINKW